MYNTFVEYFTILPDPESTKYTLLIHHGLNEFIRVKDPKMGIKDRVKDLLYTKCKCPRCFKEIYPGECTIVARNNDILPPTGWPMRPGPLVGTFYAQRFARRKCYECDYLLPDNIERVPNIRLAIIGDNLSGKSHYLAALVHDLKELAHKSRLYSLRCLTPEAELRIDRECSNPLFVDLREINRTQRPMQWVEPLIYQIIRL
jgi:hypothetical protein